MSAVTALQSKEHCYNFIEVVDEGTFGEVIKAWKRGTDEYVAIKKIWKNCPKSHIIRNELKLLEAISQLDPEESNIVHFIEYFQDSVNHYLVFELLHANLLQYQDSINYAPIPVRHIRTITSQILKALMKLSEISVVHADIKLENIMLVDQNRYPFKVKLVDFGSASILSEVKHVQEPYIQTRFYRAPEILLGLPFDGKADMWSLGCVMAELHLGCTLYPGINEYDQIRYICDTQGLPPNHLLDAGRKSLRFFQRSTNSNGETQWRIKTKEEYRMETNRESQETRAFWLESLDQIGDVKSSKFIFGDGELLAEYYDLVDMVELIKKMLTWDSHERITPIAALQHHFICFHHPHNNHMITRYDHPSMEEHFATCKSEPYIHYSKPLVHRV